MSVIIGRLSQYNFSDEEIANIKTFLQSGKFPADYEPRQKRRMTQKYGDGDWTVRQGKIIYTPKNLEVVPEAKKETTLLRLYKDPKGGLGKGIKTFHQYVISKYLGITRKEVEKFLKSQGDYQISRPIARQTNKKPVLSTYANQRWHVDTVFMLKYAQKNAIPNRASAFYKYILVIVDNFSRYVFARPMQTTQSSDVVNAMKSIIDDAGIKPSVIQADGGAEFAKDFKTFCKDNDIKIILSTPFSPTSNSIVERTNRELRRKIKAGFVANDTLEWAKHLPDYVENINNQRHGTTKKTPAELWSPTKNKLTKSELDQDIEITDKSTPKEVQQSVQAKQTERLKEQIARKPEKLFEKDDLVRIKLSSIQSKMRKLLKSGGVEMSKQIAVSYSPKVYRILKVNTKPSDTKRARYSLVDLQGASPSRRPNIVKATSKIRSQNKLFYGDELMKINETLREPKIRTIEDANIINLLDKDFKEKRSQRQNDNAVAAIPRIELDARPNQRKRKQSDRMAAFEEEREDASSRNKEKARKARATKARNRILRGSAVTHHFSDEEVKNFIDASYHTDEFFDVNGYTIDQSISSDRVKTYYKSPKDVVVVHRGSYSVSDWLDNYQLARYGKLKSTNTFKIHEEQHNKALDKYGAENIVGIGHSRGSSYLSALNRDKPLKHSITLNKPVAWGDFGKRLPSNETSIRTSRDPVSMFRFLERSRNKRTVPIKTLNPLTAHGTMGLL